MRLLNALPYDPPKDSRVPGFGEDSTVTSLKCLAPAPKEHAII